jgi:mannose-6-phosphate isomerase-like protein (cupin superfamily)
VQGSEPTAVVLAGDGEILLDSPRRTIRALCEHELIDVTWSRYAAGEPGPVPHIHRRHVDAFVVVDGELEFVVGPQLAAVRAGAGTFVLVPPLAVHTFANTSSAPATWLNFHAPSTGFLAYVRGESEAFDSADVPAAGQLDTADGVVVAAAGDDGDVLQRESDGLRVLGDTPQLAAVELSLQPGFAKERSRPDEVASFFVLDGEVELIIDDAAAQAGPGTWLCAPPGVPHGLRNTGSGVARVLNTRAPGRRPSGSSQ